MRLSPSVDETESSLTSTSSAFGSAKTVHSWRRRWRPWGDYFGREKMAAVVDYSIPSQPPPLKEICPKWELRDSFCQNAMSP